jgi:hypothetical protein
MKERLMNRREFNRLCAVLGSLPAASAMFTSLPGASALAATTDAAANRAGRTVKFRDGTVVTAVPTGN